MSIATDNNDPMEVNHEASDKALLNAIQARILDIYTVACESTETHCTMFERLAEEALDLLETYTDRHKEPVSPEDEAAAIQASAPQASPEADE